MVVRVDATIEKTLVKSSKNFPSVFSFSSFVFTMILEFGNIFGFLKKLIFFSSNSWDVAGASVFGFSVVWVNRFNQPAERLPGIPRLTVKNLDEWWEKEMI